MDGKWIGLAVSHMCKLLAKYAEEVDFDNRHNKQAAN
eukprot:CAMPEP_0116879462 /NCGR_PEP_ID=MMETSP0463-20121206/11279_1 /TAXON_ID=181622 /ORGANISM="Strombidinopsis sp, Strain SopsisLIS2011" /LENGTH=36 /DNA_ID= /DNA_START= /DNA_END= /DNA_ORIENTATION=